MSKDTIFTHHCPRRCIDIYKQLGKTQGPSVVLKVIIAFVIPLFVFIGVFVVAQYLLSSRMKNGDLSSLISFLIALITTIACIFLIKIVTRRPIPDTSEDEKTV